MPADPAWLEQVHGIEVVDLDRPCEHCKAARRCIRHAPAGPRLRRRGPPTACLCCSQTRDGTGVGAAHAGWRGLAAGVLEATVAAMRVDAEDSRSVDGAVHRTRPISRSEMKCAPLSSLMHAKADAAFSRNARGRWQCDLYALARQRIDCCRYSVDFGRRMVLPIADPERFYSYRRDGQHRAHGCAHLAGLSRQALAVLAGLSPSSSRTLLRGASSACGFTGRAASPPGGFFAGGFAPFWLGRPLRRLVERHRLRPRRDLFGSRCATGCARRFFSCSRDGRAELGG